MYSLKNILVVFVVFSTSFAYAQPHNTARLTAIIGSHIEFNFNSIADYENGKEIINGTTLGINCTNLPAGGVLTGWHLDVQTFLGATDFVDNSGGATLLPSETLQIEATDANGNLGTATFNGLQDLTAAGSTLMTSLGVNTPANGNTHQVNLTYQCGMLAGNNLLGTAGGYYTIEIEVIPIPDF